MEEKGQPKEAIKVEEKKPEITVEPVKKRSGHNGLAITLAALALILSGVSATFSYLSYQKASTPLTILSSGVDGNSANFVEDMWILRLHLCHQRYQKNHRLISYQICLRQKGHM